MKGKMAMDFSDNLRMQLFKACADCEIPIISNERCMQLMAWLYVYGGGQEITTSGGKLTAHILYAQKTLRIDGASVLPVETISGIKKYIAECYQKENPEWLKNLCMEYGINANKGQEEER